MLFVLVAKDRPNSIAQRMAHRAQHLEHLAALGSAVVFAGPLLDEAGQPAGSLISIEAPDLANARAMLEQDPFVLNGQFESYSVQAWRWGINNPDRRGEG